MRPSLRITVLALLLATAAFAAFYVWRGAAGPSKTPPELAWIHSSFQLSDSQFQQVCQLHWAYAPRCREMCQKIEEKNQLIAWLLKSSTSVTPELNQALRDAATLRAECQAMMLEHFYETAQVMPPPQASNYLSAVTRTTIGSLSAP